jgi:major membrane immunogen (membrane-anchored lipoprotein)
MNRIIFVLVMLSLVLSACGGSSNSTFPTGKFVESTNDQGGFIFNEDGTWEAYNGIYTMAKGTYSATDTTYTEETSNSDCPTVTVAYTFDGTNLTFNYIGDPSEDPCDGRRAGFDNKTYVLQK